MKKRDIEIEFAKIRGEFNIIKRLIYIILAVLIGLLLKAFWTTIVAVPSIVGNAVKNIFQ